MMSAISFISPLIRSDSAHTQNKMEQQGNVFAMFLMSFYINRLFQNNFHKPETKPRNKIPPPLTGASVKPERTSYASAFYCDCNIPHEHYCCRKIERRLVNLLLYNLLVICLHLRVNLSVRSLRKRLCQHF
jgi:hypothetical protein